MNRRPAPKPQAQVNFVWLDITSADVPPFDPGAVAAQDAGIFLKALVAGYAPMARADGEVASAERRRLFAIIRETPPFEAFSPNEVIEDVERHEANFRRDPEGAQHSAWTRLSPGAGERRARGGPP